jgi:hypothetical protein
LFGSEIMLTEFAYFFRQTLKKKYCTTALLEHSQRIGNNTARSKTKQKNLPGANPTTLEFKATTPAL